VESTSNGGRSWRPVAIPSDATLNKYGFQVIDQSNVLLQLSHGLLATSDAGRTWHQVSLPPGQSFGLGAHFLSPKEGWYQDLAAYPNQSAQPSSMWWTTNAGASWRVLWQVNTQHPSAGAISLDGAKFVLGFDGTVGWMTLRPSNSERFIETTDAGGMWTDTALPVDRLSIVYEVRQLGAGSAVLIAVANSRWWAMASTDGGRTWADPEPIPIVAPTNRGGYDRPAFLSSTRWLVSDGSVIHATSDGGHDWHDIRAHLPAEVNALHDLWLFPDGNGWATATDAADREYVVRTDNGGSTWSLAPVPN
jgi:photosystem II stability/assembly factor-like uncharacterized protein